MECGCSKWHLNSCPKLAQNMRFYLDSLFKIVSLSHSMVCMELLASAKAVLSTSNCGRTIQGKALRSLSSSQSEPTSWAETWPKHTGKECRSANCRKDMGAALGRMDASWGRGQPTSRRSSMSFSSSQCVKPSSISDGPLLWGRQELNNEFRDSKQWGTCNEYPTSELGHNIMPCSATMGLCLQNCTFLA